jgi:hypothetical protein
MSLKKDFLKYFIQHCFIYCPSDSPVSEDAEIKPRTVVTLAFLAWQSDALTTRLDLIHNPSNKSLTLSALSKCHIRPVRL